MHSDFERYQEALPAERIIRYEDAWPPAAGRSPSSCPPPELDEPFENKNLNPLCRLDKNLRFGEKLLQGEGAYRSLLRRWSGRGRV